MSDLPITGERTVPGLPSENYWFRRHEAAYRFAAHLAEPPVLDAGCGEGYGTAMLSRRGPAIGLDLDAATATHAARRYAGARFLRGDLCRLPVGRAGTVVALQVLEHLWCPGELLDTCADALGPTGSLIVSTPNRETFPAGRNPSHVHEYSAPELDGLLRSRFRDVRLLGLRHRAGLRLLDRALGEPVQHRLARTPWPELPAWARAVLRTVRAWDFAVTRRLDGALDLLAVCRSTAAGGERGPVSGAVGGRVRGASMEG